MFMRPAQHRPLHVLVATPSAAAGKGGVDRVMALLRQQLAQDGRAELAVRFLPTRGDGHIALSPLFTLLFCLRMARAKLFGRVDVVHINLASDGSTWRKLVIANWARLLAIPYAIHLHGGEYPRFWGEASPLVSGLIRRLFANAAQIIVLGQVWRRFIAQRVPQAIDRIWVIPNAAPVPHLPPQRDDSAVNILFLGRLNRGKGAPDLIAALEALGSSRAWRATLAGDGDVEGTRARLAASGLTDRVEVPGWVGAEVVATLLAKADILALPSLAENLPLSVIEAMAAGLAVVATPVGAVPDIVVPGHTGLLVPPGDVPALTAALAELIDDKALRLRLGQNAQAFHRDKLDVPPFAEAIVETWRRAAACQQPVREAQSVS